MHKVKAHALDIMCPQMGGEMWIPLLYCQQRCLNLIKCLITFSLVYLLQMVNGKGLAAKITMTLIFPK